MGLVAERFEERRTQEFHVVAGHYFFHILCAEAAAPAMVLPIS